MVNQLLKPFSRLRDDQTSLEQEVHHQKNLFRSFFSRKKNLF
jgi:hypothetical protein